jgi:hypothetical protein
MKDVFTENFFIPELVSLPDACENLSNENTEDKSVGVKTLSPQG